MIALDDYKRAAEQRIVENWLSVYLQSFDGEIIKEKTGLAAPRKSRHVEANWHHPSRQLDAAMTGEHCNRIESALLHLNDVLWLDWLKTRGLSGSDADAFMRVIHVAQSAYGVSIERLADVAKADAQLTSENRRRVQVESVKCCPDVFGLLN